MEWNTQLYLQYLQYSGDFSNFFSRHPPISFSVVSLFLSQVDNVDFFPHPYGARRRRLPPCAQKDGRPIVPKLKSVLSSNYQHTAVVGKANCEWGWSSLLTMLHSPAEETDAQLVLFPQSTCGAAS